MNNKLNKAKYIISELQKAGFEAFIVGGAVRDYIMGKEPGDFDIATSATPDIIEKIFKRTISVGKQFGVIVVLIGEEQFEVATFRKDLGYSDGRRPDKVEFSNAKEDILRRDFTINGLFWHPETNEIIDYVGGQEDIKKKLIRCIGNPLERFEEDKLRILRAVRFASNLNFQIEKQTWEVISNGFFSLEAVSQERIRIEFEKIISRPNAIAGLHLLKQGKLSGYVIFNELFPESEPFPDVTDILFNETANLEIDNALALLYVSSPNLIEYKLNNGIYFIAEDFKEKLKRLKIYFKNHTFSNKVTNNCIEILDIILSILSLREYPLSVLRKQIGRPNGVNAYNILKAINNMLGNEIPVIKKLEEVLKVYKNEILPKPLINGDDLIEKGHVPGLKLAKILEHAHDIQLNEDIKDKSVLMEKIKSKELS
ncbi:MAG: Polynucleotide adenylyltransferase/metal dependent phosphohydrolase [uncultured bacterium]|nr:MAG: Polynucleotide adenylyltransferase/metal dependent phosphohydrolase [uncultured bacterium]